MFQYFRCVLDVATLTGAMSVALGTAATGVFANNTEVRKLSFQLPKSIRDEVIIY